LRPPDHIAVLLALRRDGVPVHIALTKAEIPVPAGRHLVLIGDDPDGGCGLGPKGWHGPPLRRLLRSLKPGAVGVFAGAPVPSAYQALCFAAANLPGGAVIVEVNEARFVEWRDYTLKHARHASRFDIAPRSWSPSPSVIHLGSVAL